MKERGVNEMVDELHDEDADFPAQQPEEACRDCRGQQDEPVTGAYALEVALAVVDGENHRIYHGREADKDADSLQLSTPAWSLLAMPGGELLELGLVFFVSVARSEFRFEPVDLHVVIGPERNSVDRKRPCDWNDPTPECSPDANSKRKEEVVVRPIEALEEHQRPAELNDLLTVADHPFDQRSKDAIRHANLLLLYMWPIATIFELKHTYIKKASINIQS